MFKIADIPELYKNLKVAMFDIETNGLRGDYGKIVATSVKPLDKTAKVFRIDDVGNKDMFSDKWVVRETIKELNKFDVLVTWYGSRFDFPFINTRALRNRLLPPVKNYRRDLWITCRFNFKLARNSLEHAHRFFFGYSNKTHTTPDMWDKILRGDKRALHWVEAHVRVDVKETEDLYKLFAPLYPKKLRKQ